MNERATAGPALLLRGGTLVTMDETDAVVQADVLIADGRIAAIGERLSAPPDATDIDVKGMWVLPGFVQPHVHLCQALWRNRADDLGLMDWLRLRTWPLEAVHDPDTIAASARLAAAELLLGGTTCVQDFGTVRHTASVVTAARALGLRGVFGKALMDHHDGPSALSQDPDEAVGEALALARDLADGDLVRFALAPRFAASSSGRLLEAVSRAARETALGVHTNASETADENAATVARFGARPDALNDRLGLLGPGLRLAHCVHVTPDEIARLAETGTRVLHCPSANLKLGSGIAPIPAMLDAGVVVSLGADGPPCNNNLCAFNEMRAAALIQKPVHGPTAMPAARVLRMATIDGARALGLEDEIGSIAVGKRADLSVLDRDGPHCVPADDPAAAIVYSMGRGDVRHVLVGGRVVVRDRTLTTGSVPAIVADAREAAGTLAARAGITAAPSPAGPPASSRPRP
jgi:cytosine/adenosine deaminase-related metal-dependent hydrolase